MATCDEAGIVSGESSRKPEPEAVEKVQDGAPTHLSFRLFTKESYKEMLEKEITEREVAEKQESKAQEAHLVDGELVFGSQEDEVEKPPPPNTDLIAGHALREEYGICPTPYFGRPLEEIDKGISAKTFVVIAKKFRSKNIFRFSATSAFYILPPWNIVRRIAVFVATHQLFDIFIILTILVNCVFLTMPDLDIAETAEIVFLAVYVIEMMVKMTARGFLINEYTYLRDPWNWLDFIVIVIAFLTIIIQKADPSISVGNLNGLRTFRVLRALKTISIVPGLKTIVNALLRAFKMLFEVILLTCFCLMVIALFGLQIYMGSLRQKCVMDIDDYTPTASVSYDQYYAMWIRDEGNWEQDEEGDYVLCGNTTGSGGCSTNYTCLGDIGENPNYGLTNFDHFGWSMLTSFQLLTLDFWEDTYSKVIRANGPWNVVFFLVIIFFGSFYLLNLMLAVVAMSYEEEAINTGKERERDRVADAKKKEAKPMANSAMVVVKSQQLVRKARSSLEAKRDSLNQTSDHPGNGNDKNSSHFKQVNPQKPLVKVPSMDSGYSSQSQPSTTTKTKDTALVHQNSCVVTESTVDVETDSLDSAMYKAAGVTAGSTNATFKDSQPSQEFKRKTPLVKQDGMGTIAPSAIIERTNVSSSGVCLEKDSISILEEDEVLSASARQNVIILTDELAELPDGTFRGKLVDRNCERCRHDCCCDYITWLRIEGFFYCIVSNPFFDLFITTCIVLNTVLLASEHHGMSGALEITLHVGNYVFSSVFIMEAVMKITALNKFYFRNSWNVFDLVIVGASIVDMGVENVEGLSVLRAFRLLRVVKLAQSWSTMRILLTIIINTFSALSYLTVVLILIIYIFAVMGLQLFKTDYEKFDFGDTEAERWHFKDFYHSFMMIFRVLCGEWIEPLWQCMRASQELCMVVFLPSLIIGHFIILNLFLALLINAFASDTLSKHKQSVQEANKLGKAVQQLKEFFCCCCPFVKKNTINPTKVKSATSDPDPLINSIIPEGEGQDRKKSTTSNGGVKVGASTVNETVQADAETTDQESAKAKEETKDDVKTEGVRFSDDPLNKLKEPKKEGGDVVDDLELGDTAASIQKDNSEDSNENVAEPPNCFPNWMRKRMKFMDAFNESPRGKKWYKVRSFVLRIAENRFFEWTILCVIFSSSITLAFEDIYLYQKPKLKKALYILNIVFAVLFSVEMVLKWIGYGFNRYFTQFWTILDFFIVLISIASLIGDSLGVSNIAAFRSLRTLRAMRPLRAISRWPGMRIVVNSLMRAIPAIFNVLLVGLMFWLIFSIMGVQFFSGKFYKCINSTTGAKYEASVVPNKTTCNSLGESWENSKINFDDTFSASLALFQVATFEGWMEVMEDAVDSTDVDQQPSFEASKYSYIFFLIFIVVGAFFTLNLFISVIIDNFNVLKKKYEGSYLDAFLTESQRNYFNTLKKLGGKKPTKTITRPKSKFVLFFYKIAMSTRFELAITSLIALNMVVMGGEHYKQPVYVTEILKMLNIIFTTIFVFEALVKLLGLRWHYFRIPWNIFDFLIVLMSIMDIILDDLLNSVIIKPTLLRVVRVFRIGRVLRLIKSAKGIRKLLFALIISLPAIFNIGALLFLVMYIYAIIGMSSFGDVKLGENLDDQTNFQTFGNSFLLLIRLSTSAGWNDVLDGLLVAPPYCNDTHRTLPDGSLEPSSFGDCGVPWLAIPFMVTYITIVFLIVINMYIAVILENFNQAHQQEEVGITEDDFDMFYSVWEGYDPHATQFIKYEQLSDFVADLVGPMQIVKPNEIKLVSFNLPIYEGDKLHCLDILMALIKNHLPDVEETNELRELREQMLHRFGSVFPSREKLGVKSTTLKRKKEDVAARTLQRAWHSHKTQRDLKNLLAMAMRQNSLRKHSAVMMKARKRLVGVQALGNRITSALTNFFGPTQSGSASSHDSTQSIPGSPEVTSSISTLSRRGKLSNSLMVPKVSTLYGQSSDNQDLDL